MENKKRSALAIAGLVLGIIALLTSLLPIVNNLSFIVALIGAVLAIIGLVACVRGKRGGRGLAIAAVAVNVIAVAAVLASQSAYSAAIDDAMKGPQVVDSSNEADSKDEQGSDNKADADAPSSSTDLAVGASATLDNGLTVSVDSVTPGLTNYDGSTVTEVRVTYKNTSDEALDFNVYDWKGEDANGVQKDSTYYSEGSEELGYGSIAAGGTATGAVYFEGDIVKALYFSNVLLSSEATASWKLA